MNRVNQLEPLNQEHESAIVFANKILIIAKSEDRKVLFNGIETIKKYYNTELEVHFQHEERTIFSPIFKEHREHIQMATALLKEHGFIRLLIQRINLQNANKELYEFATVLKNHTHIEEKTLFPLVTSLFSDEQLQAVINFTPVEQY
ncbi:MAG: hemerythrin domain-containing protein [Cocleimonas sp.]|nr:hemerythrin domain-containing protein [Cocleimonas sp.]